MVEQWAMEVGGTEQGRGKDPAPGKKSVHSGLESFLFQDSLMWPTFNIFVEFVIKLLLFCFVFFCRQTWDLNFPYQG